MKENQLHRFNWRTASRACALTLTASACAAAAATAQTPAPTTPAATTPPTEIAVNNAPIAPNGTDNVSTPGVNECYARLFEPKDIPAGYDIPGAIAVQYRIRCSSDVSSYAVSFNREVDATETEIFPTLLVSNSLIADESFSCNGDFPGIGINCVGTYKGRFSTIRGVVSLALTDEEVAAKTTFCDLGITASVSTFTSAVSRDPYSNKPLINKDGSSQIRLNSAGPFRVTQPTCHGSSKAKKKAKKTKAHA